MTKSTPKKNSPRCRLKALSRKKQAVLLNPAEREFIEKGYNKASLNKILNKAGMSKGQAYYYIENKADLYRSVCERAFKNLATISEINQFNPVSRQQFWTEIRSLFEQIAMYFIRNKKLAALGHGVYESAEAEAALRIPIGKIHSHFDDLVSVGQKLGAIRNDLPRELIASALFGAIRAIDRWFASNVSKLPENEIRQLNEKAVEMLEAFATPVKPTRQRIV
ncbi:hypothetical protein MNBD_ALPHA03-1018 [hydrothermal vent metagenome]|uniref:HTH tetR-type domain-containing protein n=1 Tax=hydrothermal vent metagenome TaxID=652676 RepID=A0A3B1BPZ5_9ZZZZ